MKYPKPRAKIGDVVIVRYMQVLISDASYNEKWEYQIKCTYRGPYHDEDILENLTTGEVFKTKQ